MPDSYVATLEYSDVVIISSLGTAFAGHTFRGNSLYDPDFTGTGQQPLYFDQLMQTYSKYKVISAKVTVHFIGSDAAFVFLVPLTDALTFGPFTPKLLEYPRSKAIGVGNASIMPSQSMTGFFTTRAIMGLSNAQLQDESYSGSDSTNPGQQWYINIAVCKADLTEGVVTRMLVKISYTSVFYDRIALNPSYSTPSVTQVVSEPKLTQNPRVASQVPRRKP
jgi:hypothetical protein